MEALLILILPCAVAFFLHGAYKLGIAQGEYNASRKYSRQVDDFHETIYSLRAQAEALRLEYLQLKSEVQHVVDMKELEK